MYALTILPFPLFLFTLQLGQINNQQMSQLEPNQSSLYMSNVKQPLTTSIKITLSLSHFHSLSHLNLGFMKIKKKPIFFFYSFFSSLLSIKCTFPPLSLQVFSLYVCIPLIHKFSLLFHFFGSPSFFLETLHCHCHVSTLSTTSTNTMMKKAHIV